MNLVALVTPHPRLQASSPEFSLSVPGPPLVMPSSLKCRGSRPNSCRLWLEARGSPLKRSRPEELKGTTKSFKLAMPPVVLRIDPQAAGRRPIRPLSPGPQPISFVVLYTTTSQPTVLKRASAPAPHHRLRCAILALHLSLTRRSELCARAVRLTVNLGWAAVATEIMYRYVP